MKRILGPLKYIIKNALQVEIFFITLILLVGSLMFHAAEGVSTFDSFYFSVITLAGVGYGDIVPHTVRGKIIAMVYGILGTPLFVIAGGLIAQELMNLASYDSKHQSRVK